MSAAAATAPGTVAAPPPPTYVGLRRDATWQVLAIAREDTTVVWEGQAAGTELHALAGALLADLTGRRPPSAARAAVARSIGPELSGSTFVVHGEELGRWATGPPPRRAARAALHLGSWAA